MIDRQARNEAIKQARRFLSREITNDEFADRYPSSHDSAINEIFWLGFWNLYDDLKEHKLDGKNTLPEKTKADVERWLLFLETDNEYSWPSTNKIMKFVWIPIDIITLFFSKYLRNKHYRNSGDIEVWPFINHEDFEKVKVENNNLKP